MHKVARTAMNSSYRSVPTLDGCARAEQLLKGTLRRECPGEKAVRVRAL